MNLIKTILVPVDFGEISACSYRYALRLAEQLSASVHLLHCLPAAAAVPAHGHMIIDMTPQLHAQAEGRMQSFLDAGLAEVSGVVNVIPEVSYTLTGFGLGEGIELCTEENQVDLIVAGTHGFQDGWDRMFGTNAAFLVGKVRTPILVLPAGTEFRPLKSICFATDLRECDLLGAERLSETLVAFEPAINFLHVHLPKESHSAGALDLFRRAFERPRAGLQATFTTVFNDDVTDGIFSFLAKNPHDLLVMVKPERGWWDRLFTHSETRESAGITSLPLLILGEDDPGF